jgi:hypothetical protein
MSHKLLHSLKKSLKDFGSISELLLSAFSRDFLVKLAR